MMQDSLGDDYLWPINEIKIDPYLKWMCMCTLEEGDCNDVEGVKKWF